MVQNYKLSWLYESFLEIKCQQMTFSLYVTITFIDKVIFILQIRQNDRLAVSKLVTSLIRGSVRSPLAQCLLIRYTSQASFFLNLCTPLHCLCFEFHCWPFLFPCSFG